LREHHARATGQEHPRTTLADVGAGPLGIRREIPGTIEDHSLRAVADELPRVRPTGGNEPGQPPLRIHDVVGGDEIEAVRGIRLDVGVALLVPAEVGRGEDLQTPLLKASEPGIRGDVEAVVGDPQNHPAGADRSTGDRLDGVADDLEPLAV